MNIFSKHKTNTLIDIEKNNLNELKSTYENFINSDLCFGVEDKIDRKISLRNIKSTLRFTREFLGILYRNLFIQFLTFINLIVVF